MTKTRNYRNEYDAYQGKPEQINKRAARVMARRAYEKEHGDVPSSEDIDHTKPLSKGGTSSMSNLRAVPKGVNRSFSRTSTGALKSQKSARESKK